MEERNKKVPVTVKILNQNYEVSCHEDEKDVLFNSAELLNDKMMKIRLKSI